LLYLANIYNVNGFKKYMSEESDVKKTLEKIPAAHRKLAQEFKLDFESSNTLKGDGDHVGVIQTHPKPQIRVASPWHYGREFVLLHEIAHIVYEKYVRGTEFEKKWIAICKATPNKKKDEPAEENWCHGYSNYFCKHKVVIHTHPEWERYFKNFLSQFK
jgi:hypothetical protein